MSASYEDVLVEALVALEQQGAAGAERIAAAHPEHGERLRAHLGRLHRFGLLEQQTRAGASGNVPAPDFPERLGDFRLLQRLGGGGMGVVYLAEQVSLGRRVALKLVRAEHLWFPGSLDRFRREVEAIAKLQHPAIVPVFAAGEDAGVPWLAMEHVGGASLDEIVQWSGGRDPAQLTGQDMQRAIATIVARRQGGIAPAAEHAPAATFAGSWVSASLRIVHAVALALQHAHDRGVLHRDVKPSNVMVTLDGRALLLDFGLALTDGAPRLTGSGGQVGSPAYMSPEQLRGDLRRIDARTDVYSLGVTLYELTTLRMPFVADSAATTRDLVLAGRAVAMRPFNRAIPRDVEVVCSKAMDVEAGRRYPTAAAFAADLDNVLQKRPIAARAPGTALIVWRWAQRHPARATALVAGVLLFFVAPTVFLVQQRTALAAERRQAAFAREAVDTMLTRVAEEDLLTVPRMLDLRRDLLVSAREFYERFLADAENDPGLQHETARRALRVALLEVDLGRIEAALAMATRAEGLARSLADAAPDDVAAGILLTEALNAKGSSLQALSRLDEAIVALDDAWSRCQHLVALAPADPKLAHLMVSLGTARGLALSQLRRSADAATAYDQVAALWQRAAPVVHGTTHESDTRDQALSAFVSEAQFRFVQKDLAAAKAALARAAEMTAGTPAEALEISSRISLARASLIEAKIARVEGDGPAQEASCRDSQARFEAILTDFPDHANALRGLATALNDRGHFYINTADRKAEAAPLFDRSIATLRRLIEVDPAMLENRVNLAATLINVGSQRQDAGDLSGARALFEEAAEIAHAGWSASPTRERWQLVAFNALWFLGLCCGRLGDHEAVVAAADKLVTVQPDDARTHRIAGGVLAQAIPALAKDTAIGEAERAARRRAIEDAALARLREAARLGATEVEWLRTHKDPAPLRALDGFSAIVAQFEANAAKAKPAPAAK